MRYMTSKKLTPIAMGFAYCLAGAVANANVCEDVSGTGVTRNLTNSTQLGVSFGDLKAAIYGEIIASNFPLIVLNHTLTLESRDMVFTAGDEAILTPISEVVSRVNETLYIVGGTGRFDGASGQLSVSGILDSQTGKNVFLYEGTVCTVD